MTARAALALGALLMLVAVALGAFGAHALKARMAPDLLDVWHTAVQYQAWHALGMIGVGLYLQQRPAARGMGVAALLFVAGIVLFSGSLYALALSGTKAIGAITPLGGVAFLGGWIAFAWSAWRN